MRQMLARLWRDIKAYGLIVGILFVLWLVCTACFKTACITVLLTGFPCPGCGMGHAFLSLLTGNLAQAHFYNPSIWLWLIYGVCFFLYRYVLGKKNKYMGWLLTIVAVLSVAIYLYRMIHLFPTEPPLTYYEGNLLQQLSGFEILQYEGD